MDSKNKNATEISRQDFDELLNFVLPFAKNLLIKYGSFHPFGAYKKVDGNIAAIAGYDEQQEGDPLKSIDLLIEDLRKDALIDQIIAAAVCTSVYVQLPQYSDEISAIHVNLDHAQGDAIDIYLPYNEELGGEIRFEEGCAAESGSKIFLHD
jgi:hypothetical protein